MSSDVRTALVFTMLLFFSSVALLSSPHEENALSVIDDLESSSSKALIIWSGNVNVPNDFTVSAGDELRITAGANIIMGPGV